MSKKNKVYKNLFVDESGAYYLGEPRYRFFLMASIILKDDERNLASLLFKKWREKYQINHNKSFHAADFFEGYQLNNKPQLSIFKNFIKAADDLLKILENIEFQASVFYVDLIKLRTKYNIPSPPQKPKMINASDHLKYAAEKKRYKQKLKMSFGLLVNKPIYLVSSAIFKNHRDHLLIDKENPFCGYIHFESQADSDPILIDALHKFFHSEDGHHYKYGETIIGINFHTKGSLEAGVELADLIAYISTQSLRFKYKRKLELSILSNLSKKKIDIIKKMRRIMCNKHKVGHIEVN